MDVRPQGPTLTFFEENLKMMEYLFADLDDVERGEDDQGKVDDGGETEKRGILELAGEKEVEATRDGVEGRDGEMVDDEWETAEEEDEDDEDEEQDGEMKQDENGERGEQRAGALEVNVQSTHRMRYRTRLQSCWTCSAATAAPFRHAALSSRSFASRLALTTHLEGHSGCVNALGWDASGQRLVSGGDDLSVILWDWSRSRTLLRYDSKHRANVFQTKFLPPPGDSTIVTCARDGQVRAGHLSTAGGPPPTRRLVQHRGAAHKLALYPDSPCCFVSAGEDGQVYGLDLRQDKPSSRLTVTREGKRVALYTVHINPARPTEIAVGGRDRYAVFDQRTIGDSTWEPVTELCPKHLVSTDLLCLLLSYNDHDIFLCDVHHGDGSFYNRRFKGHRNNATVKGVNFMGSGGEFVVSGSDCGHLFVWDKESAQILLALPGDTGGVLNCLEPHPHAPLLATSGLDPDVKLWSPTATGLPDLSQLSEVLKRNKRERDEESHEPAGPFNSHMLWLLMQQLRHRSVRTFFSSFLCTR
uniref:Uncharacterized protein n=1 Tax=Eptatretus burgeri TaxID=7764 RepID=A0A8C4QNU4_EPTBU